MVEFLCYLIAFILFLICGVVSNGWPARLIPAGLAAAVLPLLINSWPG